MANKSEWKPLGGKSRNFQNTKTGEVISRRQYDKRFGSLAKTGFTTYENKARAAKIVNEKAQLARPARGRTSLKITGKSPAEIEHEIVERKIKKNVKHISTPNLKNVRLTKGKKSHTVRCDWSYEGIRAVIDQINKMSESKMWAYYVGCHTIDSEGTFHDITVLPGTYFKDKFTKSDWEACEEYLNDVSMRKNYNLDLEAINAWVRLSFNEEYAMANAIKITTRKRNAKKSTIVIPTKKRKKR
ncbi:MAG: hypothetical protein ACYDAO_09345 [Thermoplasmataceae archaeon]